jgi:hypothetical protein
MIDDLNKIRSIIESTTDVTPEVFWAKISLFERRHVCIMCFGYGLFDLYARKKKKLYELWEYTTIKPINRLHYQLLHRENAF